MLPFACIEGVGVKFYLTQHHLFMDVQDLIPRWLEMLQFDLVDLDLDLL